MRIKNLFLGLLTLLEFHVVTSFAHPEDYLDPIMMRDHPSAVSTYNQLSEIEKHCSSFLSSASGLKPGENGRHRLRAELSFQHGDWKQKNGGLPLMKFNDSSMPSSRLSLQSSLKSVSFEVNDVSSVRHFRNAVSLRGDLVICSSKDGSCVNHLQQQQQQSGYTQPRSTHRAFGFEGVYTETDEKGGERRLCLLGNSTAASCSCHAGSEFTNGFGLENEQILLVLRYPITFNLTRRAIHGEMRSLNEKADPKYFDIVYISSLLSHHQSRYQFNSKVRASTTCKSYPYHEEMLEDGIQKFTPSVFCTMLDYVSSDHLSILPNYKFGRTYLNHNEFGSILFGKENGDIGSSYHDVKLILQHIKCIPETSSDGAAAKVSAVLRAISQDSDPHVMQPMTGVSGLILNAEGSWNSSSGQLCLVGCPIGINSQSEECTSRISLYFPRALSIKQRSLVFGSISSRRKDLGSEKFLLFDSVIHPWRLKNTYYWYSTHNLSYNYLNFSLAGAYKKRTERSHVLLRYPTLKDGESPLSQLNRLSDELLIDGYLSLDQSTNGLNTRFSILMEVLSLGALLGRFYKDNLKEGFDAKANINLTNRQLLNVSAHLVSTGELKRGTKRVTIASYKNISELFLEGLYDPVIGTMHLIGCRKVAIESTATERGLDCRIEVKIQYPSETIQWLMNPIAKITITSQRSQDDLLYFVPVGLQIRVKHYQDPASTVAYRRTYEGILQNLLLGVVIAIILIQLRYMRKQTCIVPYVSLVMLVLQALCYSFPLVTGSNILFKTDFSFKDLHIYGLLPEVLDYAGRVLLLVSLLLTAGIIQMTYKTRNSSLIGPSKKRQLRVPDQNKLVLLTTLAIHTLGCFIWLAVHVNQEILFQTENVGGAVYKKTVVHLQQTRMSILEDFAGIVQDLFLLPQVLRNFFWQTPVKSLGKAYYIGLTLVRLVLHLYDYIREPILGVKFQEFKSATTPVDIAMKIAVAMTMVVLAATVHIQQNWKNKKLSLSSESEKPFASTLRQKLLRKIDK